MGSEIAADEIRGEGDARWLMNQTAPWPRCAMAGAEAKFGALKSEVAVSDLLKRLELDGANQMHN